MYNVLRRAVSLLGLLFMLSAMSGTIGVATECNYMVPQVPFSTLSGYIDAASDCNIMIVENVRGEIHAWIQGI